MVKKWCIYAGTRFQVLRRERIAGAVYLVIEDEPGHEDKILASDAEHPTDGSPCFCSPRRITVHYRHVLRPREEGE